MSVEYALMLVLVMGLISTGIGFALKDNLNDFLCQFKAQLDGSTCDGSGQGPSGNQDQGDSGNTSGTSDTGTLLCSTDPASTATSSPDSEPSPTPSPCVTPS
jgi:hypothetical protein